MENSYDKYRSEDVNYRESDYPYWTNSETGTLELWKSHLNTPIDNLIIADGAIAWRDKVIKNLRGQLRQSDEVLKCIGKLVDCLELTTESGYQASDEFYLELQNAKQLIEKLK